jgi:hypothetical protein
MIISHVKMIAFQLSLFCKNYRFSKTVLYIINRKIHGCLEIPDFFLVLNITRNMGQDGDGHAHFDQIWRLNVTINYMGVYQNIKF